jgi:Tol biopolymer transport system component
VNADGSGYHTVVEAKDIPGQPNGGTEGPAWSGPGRLLFDSNRNGGPDDWHIFAVDADGGRLVQLTKGAEGIENFPVLSPTGTFMAFAKYLATGDPNEPFGGGGIFVAEPDARNERQVTRTPAGGVDEWPDISPNGRTIAFTRGHHVEEGGGLYTVNVDGSSLTRIVPAAMEPRRPRWSADGRRIVFHSNGGRYMTESANVWVINADGSGLTQLTFENIDGQAFDPTWSPDDRFILFVHKPRGIPKNDLAVIPSVGGATCTLWAGSRAAGAWESDWAAAPEAAVVSTRHRK